ncbi:hypothetical protein RD110_08155 [Rhodoferax koreense]|uniref:Uncharacterized protein n=1 Tax=Rhodoferax koreensis TaxID=1842727 RepID=A0A1P8JTR8_9BURK|nr:hypothetical protein [Rhodoferax koreense]APW37176.1 hypothetical protein RD110_08155 [Rhodoferax koreense]
MDPITIGLALASQFAPQLIKYFSNSDTAATVAGQVIDIAKTVTGKGTPDEAATALQADPTLALQFKTAVLASETDLEKAYLADRADARARDVDLAKLGRRNVRADIMVFLDVVGLIACLVVLIFYKEKIPGEAVGLISTIAATFGLCLRDAHQYEFGSSRSSANKDLTITNLTR